MEFDTHSKLGALVSFNCSRDEVDRVLQNYGGPEEIQDLSLTPNGIDRVHVSGWLGRPREIEEVVIAEFTLGE